MLTLKIVTPEKEVYSQEVDQVSLPTPDGEITILKGHIPLVSAIVPGELTTKKGDQYYYLAIGDGFAEVKKDSVSVMADLAEEAENIDEKAAEEAKKRAEEALKNYSHLSQEEFALAAANLQKALAALKVKRRHRSKTI
jgi:F-type H+-transporting ATPase subunit epsilon